MLIFYIGPVTIANFAERYIVTLIIAINDDNVVLRP